jgi:hypothetical protein
VAGARVVLHRGALVAYVDRAGHSLRCYTDEDAVLAVTVGALRAFAVRLRRRELRFDTINGQPALRSPLAARLERAGLRLEPGALVADGKAPDGPPTHSPHE